MATQALSHDIELRLPRAEDGADLHRLVEMSPPLDPNSCYCNLLQCAHFAATGVAAERAGELVGFVSGYRIPERPTHWFVWQVVVSETCRGQGLARHMLDSVLQRPMMHDITAIETTITADNRASWRLFEKTAASLGAQLEHRVLFERERHFGGAHADEWLVTINHLDARPLTVAADNESTQQTC